LPRLPLYPVDVLGIDRQRPWTHHTAVGDHPLAVPTARRLIVVFSSAAARRERQHTERGPEPSHRVPSIPYSMDMATDRSHHRVTSGWTSTVLPTTSGARVPFAIVVTVTRALGAISARPCTGCSSRS